MHRTQVLLEERQYTRLKHEAQNTGRSIGELVRQAIDEKYGRSQERVWAALEASRGAWADHADITDSARHVEQIRQPSMDERLRHLGWD